MIPPRARLLPVLITALLTLVAACDAWLVEPVEKHPAAIFDEVWEEFDRHYSMFQVRGINWAEQRPFFRGLAANAADDTALAGVLGAMLRSLRDPHVALYTPFGTFRDTSIDSARTTFDATLVLYRYVEGYQATASGSIHWGSIEDAGYIWLPSFAGSDWSWEIDGVLDSLEPYSALIVDIRTNGGGSRRNAEQVAGRFLKSERLYSYYRFRNGIGHSDFTDYEPLRVGAAGRTRWSRPVLLLTDRRVLSSAEEFVLMMRTSSQVTVVGDTTGGGSGNPLVRELPNGWTYRMSQWIQYTPEKVTFEVVGLAPDTAVSVEASRDQSTDPVLERALLLLR